MRRSHAILCVLAFATAGLHAVLAQRGPVIGPRMAAERDCSAADPAGGEIVVCGRREEDSPYRIPKQFRNGEPIEDRHASWAARTRDERELERYGGQNVGPSGLSQHSRQIDCEWRAERQIARGERPDCTRQINPIGPIGRRD